MFTGSCFSIVILQARAGHDEARLLIGLGEEGGRAEASIPPPCPPVASAPGGRGMLEEEIDRQIEIESSEDKI